MLERLLLIFHCLQIVCPYICDLPIPTPHTAYIFIISQAIWGYPCPALPLTIHNRIRPGVQPTSTPPVTLVSLPPHHGLLFSTVYILVHHSSSFHTVSFNFVFYTTVQLFIYLSSKWCSPKYK